MRTLTITAMLLTVMSCTSQTVWDITDYGAIGDGLSDNTLAINRAVSLCSQAGGGTVLIPEGDFVSGTVFLKSGVTLKLEQGARLSGSLDLDAYASYIPSKDLSRYDSGTGTANQNCASDSSWCRALIIAANTSGAAIQGPGIIDGRNIEDPEGEEGIRGPHTIILAESGNLSISDITIVNSGNYAILGYELDNARFEDVNISGGWDGIHLRGAVNSGIFNSRFTTGDDCIAGGWWENFTIRGCRLNSSCNGIRMIMPSERLSIRDCLFEGPGLAPHRTSSSTGKPMLYGISLEPGGWGPAPGRLDRISIRGCSFLKTLSPISVTLQDDNSCGEILIENCTALSTWRMALSVKSWGTARTDKVTIRNCLFNFDGIPDPTIPEKMASLPFDQWPYFPSWGAWFRNIGEVNIENTSFTLNGRDYRPDILYDNVGKHSFTLNGSHRKDAYVFIERKGEC